MRSVICQEHGIENSSRCQWCAKTICESCVAAAGGHRLCENCAIKLSKDKPLVKKYRSDGPVKNTDSSMSADEAIAVREELKKQKEGKKPRIRNIPGEWPRIQE